jgi:quinol monooxygenase YgiN
MISVIASIKIKPGNRDEFIAIFNENVPKVLEEKGCIEYYPAIDFKTGMPIQVLDENIVTIIEKWESIEDLGNHSKSPHMAQYHKKVKDMVEDLSLKVLKKV